LKGSTCHEDIEITPAEVGMISLEFRALLADVFALYLDRRDGEQMLVPRGHLGGMMLLYQFHSF